jgi:protein SCO1/2
VSRRAARAAWTAFALAALSGTAPALQAPEKERAMLERIGIAQRIGARLPLDARFVDQDGRELALGDLFGSRPVVLALVYYECPMLCTLVLNGMTAALKGVALELGRDYDVVAISIDPGETPDLARRKRDAYAAELSGADPLRGMHFLCGEEREIRRVAEAVGFRYAYDAENDQYAHAAAIEVVTPKGELARYFYGADYVPRDVRLALVEASAGRVGSVVDQVLLLCFHYDPAQGKYGFAILNAIRLGGGLTLLALLGFVLKSLGGERRRRRAAGAEG